jgi:hypothetical protein
MPLDRSSIMDSDQRTDEAVDLGIAGVQALEGLAQGGAGFEAIVAAWVCGRAADDQ